MKTSLSKTVYGEKVSDLLPGLLAVVRGAKRVPGGYRVMLNLGPKEGLPFRRAMMRVEAELLRKDADCIGLAGSEEAERTYEQRAADALVRLFEAVADAMPPRPSSRTKPSRR